MSAADMLFPRGKEGIHSGRNEYSPLVVENEISRKKETGGWHSNICVFKAISPIGGSSSDSEISPFSVLPL